MGDRQERELAPSLDQTLERRPSVACLAAIVESSDDAIVSKSLTGESSRGTGARSGFQLFRRAICQSPESLGNDVRTANDGARALEIASDFRLHAIALDVNLPTMSVVRTVAGAEHRREDHRDRLDELERGRKLLAADSQGGPVR